MILEDRTQCFSLKTVNTTEESGRCWALYPTHSRVGALNLDLTESSSAETEESVPLGIQRQPHWGQVGDKRTTS